MLKIVQQAFTLEQGVAEMHIYTTNKLTDHKWLNLFETQARNEKGQNIDWIFASRKEQPSDLSKADAVVIVPIITNPDGFKIVLTKEYRIPLRGYEWSFPAGLIDEGETPEEAAKRELKEETGLECVSIHWTSPILFSSAGMTDESIQFVAMEVSGTRSKKNQEKNENIETFVFSIKKIRKMLFDGSYKWGAKTWPLLLYLSSKGR